MVENDGSTTSPLSALTGKGLVLYRRAPPFPALPRGISREAACETRHIAADEENIPDLANESYDFLHAVDCLADCADQYNALTNWIRVIRPGGHLVLHAPPPDTDALLARIKHIAEPLEGDPARSAAGREPGAVVLRKRDRPMAPTDSRQSAPAKMLAEFTRRALNERRAHPDIARFNDILSSGACRDSVVDLSRLYTLYQWLLSTRNIPGACLEVGCYKGGTAKLISESILRHDFGCAFHVFDTFGGMPDTLAPDEAGFLNCFSDNSLARVRRLLANNPDTFVHPGIFPDSASEPIRALAIRFAHIDVDIERSVLECCAFVYPRLVAGGVMVFDDYGDPYCPGAARAADEYFRDLPDSLVHLPLLGSAVLIKRA